RGWRCVVIAVVTIVNEHERHGRQEQQRPLGKRACGKKNVATITNAALDLALFYHVDAELLRIGSDRQTGKQHVDVTAGSTDGSPAAWSSRGRGAFSSS